MTPPAPVPPPPSSSPAPEKGTKFAGFLIAWVALIVGYFIAFWSMAAYTKWGGCCTDAQTTILILISIAPWLLLIGLIAGFACTGKTQTAKGAAIGLGSIAGILLLLAVAFFVLMAGNDFR